jgi:hypothetical protein
MRETEKAMNKQKNPQASKGDVAGFDTNLAGDRAVSSIALSTLLICFLTSQIQL